MKGIKFDNCSECINFEHVRDSWGDPIYICKISKNWIEELGIPNDCPLIKSTIDESNSL